MNFCINVIFNYVRVWHDSAYTDVVGDVSAYTDVAYTDAALGANSP